MTTEATSRTELKPLASDLWHAERGLAVYGMPAISRMTIVRLSGGGLWLHSPIALDAGLRAQLDAIGPVAHIVAPNLFHHRFVAQAHDAYPDAMLWGAPGLRKKQPELPASLCELNPMQPEAAWRDELDQVFIGGIGLLSETVWFHHASRTLVLTDLCQCMDGPLALPTALFARLTGVREQLAVPRTVRLVTRDRAAAAQAARRVLDWPVERIVVGHNRVIERDAKARLEAALRGGFET